MSALAPTAPALDRLILRSNLLAAVPFVILLIGMDSPPLAVIAAGYVAVVSPLLARRRTRETVGSAWALASVLWLMVFAPVEGSGSWAVAAVLAVVVGAGTFAAWQLAALFVRHALGSTTPHPPA